MNGKIQKQLMKKFGQTRKNDNPDDETAAVAAYSEH